MKKENFERYYISQLGVLIRENKCLILGSAEFPGLWDLPGGRIEIGEARDAALKREILEETGLTKVRIIDFVGYHLRYTERRHRPVCNTVMLIENNTGTVKLSSEHLQYKWVTEKQLTKVRMYLPALKPFMKKGFKLYREYKRKK